MGSCAQRACRSGSGSHAPATNLGGTEVYDTFLVDPHQTKEWTGVAASVHFDEQLFGNNDKQAEDQISDHRPAYADFGTTSDNDSK